MQTGDATTPMALTAAFDEMRRLVHVSDDPIESMHSITEAAVAVIPGCNSASISLVTPEGPETRASTGELASAGDRIQYAEGEGPCLDAAMNERFVLANDLGTEQRWGRSSSRICHELGVGSMLACRLAHDVTPERTLGAFNLYGREREAFTEESLALATLLASLSTVVVAASTRQANLKAAIESRQVIGEAIGILRTQSDMTRDDAFNTLVKASQRMNIKLRTIAEGIVEGGVPK